MSNTAYCPLATAIGNEPGEIDCMGSDCVWWVVTPASKNGSERGCCAVSAIAASLSVLAYMVQDYFNLDSSRQLQVKRRKTSG